MDRKTIIKNKRENYKFSDKDKLHQQQENYKFSLVDKDELYQQQENYKFSLVDKDELYQQLKNFKKSVNKDFPIRKMYFFGSRAKGKPHKYSDIDLIIVSPKFRKLNFFKRGANMYNYWNLNYPVDFLCYTPEEFRKLSKGITMVREAVKEGIAI